MGKFKHNKVEIIIQERSGKKGKVQIPWLPATIEYKCGEQIVASYDILNRGEVEVPTASGLATVSWESQFPGVNRGKKNSLQRGTWHMPQYYHKIFNRWIKNGTDLKLIVTGYPINMDVHLSNYEATPGGGFGDMEYSVTFTEDRDIVISKTAKKKKDQNSTNKRISKKTTTYTVKKGDTIWKISKKFLGSGSKWKTIYNANKTIIESTAKKRGYKSSNNGSRLFAGTKLAIPTQTKKAKQEKIVAIGSQVAD